MKATSTICVVGLWTAILVVVTPALATHACDHAAQPTANPWTQTIGPLEVGGGADDWYWVEDNDSTKSPSVTLGGAGGNVDLEIRTVTVGGNIGNMCSSSTVCTSTNGAGLDDECLLADGKWGVHIFYVSGTGVMDYI